MATQDITNDLDKEQAGKILEDKLSDPVASKDVPVVEDNSIPISNEEDIEKICKHKDWTFEAEYEINWKGEVKTELFQRTYTQKPLSWQAFGEFTGLIGRKLAEAMRGPDGLSLDRISPGNPSIPLEFRDGQINWAGREDENIIDPVIQGIAKIAEYVPDLIGEAQCIWLRVPRNERGLLIDIWSRPVDEGGMSVDQGEEMLNIFIEQNYDELNGFLKRYVKIRGTVQKMRNRLTRGE